MRRVDPVTFAKLWLTVKPAKRIKLALARRKLRKASEQGVTPDVFEIEEQAEVNYLQIASVVRWIVTAVCTWAVGAGYMDENAAAEIATGLTALAMLVWSIWEKKHKKP